MKTKNKLKLELKIEQWLNDCADSGDIEGFVPPDLVDKMVDAASIVFDISERSSIFTQEQLEE